MFEDIIEKAERNNLHTLVSVLKSLEFVGTQLPSALNQLKTLIRQSEREDVPKLLWLYSLLSRLFISRGSGWLVVCINQECPDVSEENVFKDYETGVLIVKEEIPTREGPLLSIMKRLEDEGIPYKVFRVVMW